MPDGSTAHPDASAGGHDAGITHPDAHPDAPTGAPDAQVADVHADVAAPLPPTGAFWNDGVLASTTFISVCFTTAPHVEWTGKLRCEKQVNSDLSCSGDPFAGTDTASLRQSFMDLIRDSWSRSTNLEFLDYECPVSGDAGHVNGGDLPATLVVTFVTKGADPAPLTEDVTGLGKHDFASDLHVDWQGLRDRNPDALRAILRETGRVLGFPYEWLRGPANGAPNPCPADYTKDPELGVVQNTLAIVDYFSVMDRCTPTSATRPGLSPGDVIGAQWFYGNKQNGGLVGYRGYCANVPRADPTAGVGLIAFPCRTATNDSWCRCTHDVPRFEATFSGQTRCIGVRGNGDSLSGFTPAVSEACDQSTGQRIPIGNVEWRALGNMCLAAKTDHIELAFCDGSAEQKWNFMDADPATPVDWDQIQSAQTGNCVTAQTDTGNYGEQLSLSPCSTSDPHQHFRYIGDGFINYGSFCFNVLVGQPVAGERLGLWNGCGYASTYNSRFYVSGAFKSFDQCLSTRPHQGNFDDVGVEPCTPGSPREIWDYRFSP
jgi:hypothetical protein